MHKDADVQGIKTKTGGGTRRIAAGVFFTDEDRIFRQKRIDGGIWKTGKEPLTAMSNDPFEDGFNRALSINDLAASNLVKLLPFVLFCCVLNYVIQISIFLGAFLGLGYGVYLFFWNNWIEVKDIKAKLAKRRNEKREKRERIHWVDIKEMAYIVFLIVAYGFQQIFQKVQIWFAIRRNDGGYVHPGDDAPPILSMEFIKYLFGPYWLKGLFLLFRGLIACFIVTCCVWGLWLGVGVSCLGLVLYSVVYPACRDMFRSPRPQEKNG